jgi:hypothetical protein
MAINLFTIEIIDENVLGTDPVSYSFEIESLLADAEITPVRIIGSASIASIQFSGIHRTQKSILLKQDMTWVVKDKQR